LSTVEIYQKRPTGTVMTGMDSNVRLGSSLWRPVSAEAEETCNNGW